MTLSTPKKFDWCISIVSHGHGLNVGKVLTDIHRHFHDKSDSYTICLTFNIPEPEIFLGSLEDNLLEKLQIRRNARPCGFASNHNAAIKTIDAEYILIADPCLRIPFNIFPDLGKFLSRPCVGIVSPQAFAPDGNPEDNARSLVTLKSILIRHLIKSPRQPALIDAQVDFVETEWLAGLCLAMRQDVFFALQGFDERYFLYCEDVDISLRARQRGYKVFLLPKLKVFHAANRDSHKRWQHFFWHIRSLIRLWLSPVYNWAKSNSKRQNDTCR